MQNIIVFHFGIITVQW